MPSGNRTLTPTPLPTGEGLKRRASLGRSRSDFMTTIASNGYQSGFGNEFATEAVPGTLPHGRNSPQTVAHGRSEERRVGKEGVSTCRSRWWPDHEIQKTNITTTHN